jgi:hypothetical protein
MQVHQPKLVAGGLEAQTGEFPDVPVQHCDYFLQHAASEL